MTQTPTVLSPMDSVDTVKDAITTINGLTGQTRKDANQQLGIPGPGRQVTDLIWMVIIVSFALILVGAFITLALAVFAYGKLSGDLLLTVFTTAAGFLAGFLAPSPSQTKPS